MSNVTVACISDTHNSHSKVEVPKCDILIHAGDITGFGIYENLTKFDDWGHGILMHKENKICIAGNHDKTLEGDTETARVLLSSWTYLEDETHEICGLKIWGSPWSKEYHPDKWGFQLSRAEARNKWSRIPSDTDIVIVHGPPQGYGDRVEHGEHVGCPILRERLMEVKPRLTVCGHVHQGYGVYATPWGTMINAALMPRDQRSIRLPIKVSL